MLFIDWKDEASAEDLTRWQEQCDALREIEIRARDKGDPWLFHGANAGNAADIIACGPESQVRVISEDGISYMQGIYFGTLATAAVFATGLYRRSPAIIAVRASDLASAGQIFPDSNIVECGTCREDAKIWSDREDPEFPDITDADVIRMSWEESLNTLGTVAWAGDWLPKSAVLLRLGDDPALCLPEKDDDLRFGM